MTDRRDVKENDHIDMSIGRQTESKGVHVDIISAFQIPGSLSQMEFDRVASKVETMIILL
jgi:hypothetical protein